jgi:hypothetical protein
MALTDERRTQIRETLAANEDTRAGQAWANLDLDELDDEQLLSLNQWNDTMGKMEQGIKCHCGREHRVDFDNGGRWVTEGAPKNAPKLPATLNEAIQMGIGTPQELERYEFAGTMLDQKKAEILEDLTANLEGNEREEAWSEYKELPLPQLEKMHKRFVVNQRQQQHPQTLPTSYFGQQGAPTVNSAPAADVPTLESPTMTFEPLKLRKA